MECIKDSLPIYDLQRHQPSNKVTLTLSVLDLGVIRSSHLKRLLKNILVERQKLCL